MKPDIDVTKILAQLAKIDRQRKLVQKAVIHDQAKAALLAVLDAATEEATASLKQAG